jgi:hypothetical protein
MASMKSLVVLLFYSHRAGSISTRNRFPPLLALEDGEYGEYY